LPARQSDKRKLVLSKEIAQSVRLRNLVDRRRSQLDSCKPRVCNFCYRLFRVVAPGYGRATSAHEGIAFRQRHIESRKINRGIERTGEIGVSRIWHCSKNTGTCHAGKKFST